MAKAPSHRKSSGPPSKKRRERAFSKLRELQQSPFVQFVSFLLFVLGVVAVMTAGFNVRSESLSDEQIGKPALREFKADRDFIFVEQDEAATILRRQLASEQTPPVYDWRDDLGDELRDKIHRAFEATRTAQADRLRDQLVMNKPTLAPQDPSITLTPQSSDAQVIAQATTTQRIDAARDLRATNFDTHFPTSISELEYERIAATGFSPQVESTLSTIVHDVMNNQIVENSRQLDDLSEHGVYLRRVKNDQVLIEYHLSSPRANLLGRESMLGLLRDVSQPRLLEFSDTQLRGTLFALASRTISPNTTFNAPMTRAKQSEAKDAVKDVIVRDEFRKGQVIVERGELINARHVKIWERMGQETPVLSTLQTLTGLILCCLLFFVTLTLFGRYNIPNFKLKPKDVGFLAISLLLFLLLARLGRALGYAIAEQVTIIPAEAWIFAIPVAGAGMMVRLVLKTEHALMFSIVYALLCGLIMDSMLFYSAFTLLGCLVGANFVRQVKHRLALMYSGVVVATVNVLAIMAYLLLEGELFQAQSLITLALGFCGGLASGFFVSAILPVFEAGFGYTTDIKLLELANLNHPLLRELILRSPGSYHHSMMVGSLCEAAAEKIGCNSLLARVGAYYHDIGKTKNPGYFAENQRLGENPHDKLKPNMSALIIKAHVKDGVEMGKQHRLPKEIIAFIEQHHGTSLIRYFYHKAKQLEDPDIPEVKEKDYRYPGPKPQSRETAICLLADGIEAASRAMPDKTPARLKGLVQKMINNAFTDGQLDECDLTLKDLNAIAEAFTRILTGIYHHRPQYPGPSKKSGSTQTARSGKDSDNKKPAEKPNKRTKKENAGSSSGERPAPTSGERASADESSEKESGDEHRSGDARHSKSTSEDRKDRGDASDEERASLPRLGSQ